MVKGRNPKVKTEPSINKQPKTSVSTSYHNDHPAWRLGRIAMQHPYGCQELKPDEWTRLWDHLRDLEKKEWQEILVKGKKFNHNVEISQLSVKAQTRLKQMFIPLDFDELLSLRLSGKERIWGVLDRGVVTLLWWDPDHEVCPYELKNT
jgi:hypothetical protein